MKEIDIVTPVVAKTYEELDSTDRALVEAAKAATAGSYSPYSHFAVGAAILLDNGVTVTGANQDYAGANYPEARFERIAVAAVGPDGNPTASPTAPCGACRQALLEYEKRAGHNVPVLLAGSSEVYILPSVASLLPIAFSEF